jgi:DUF971 family protein
MSVKPEADVIQKLIDLIFKSGEPYDMAMSMLEALEPSIEVAYELKQTHVKPVRLITADDLVS